MRSILYYVTGHGYGHAVRSNQVIRALQEAAPGLLVHVRSTAPEWLFQNSKGTVSYTNRSIDVGIVQPNSLAMDIEKTSDACQELHRRLPSLIERELEFIEDQRIGLIIGDIPPVCFEIAARAKIPSIAVANFTWDLIYRAYATQRPELGPIVGEMTAFYSKATLALSLPYPCDMSMFTRCESIPWISRASRLTREQARTAFGLPSGGLIVLLSFGGLGFDDLPWPRLGELSEFFFVATGPVERQANNVRVLSVAQRQYSDLLRAVDAVVTKPGYGIVADILAHRLPVLYTERGEFPEYPRLVQALSELATAEFIPQADLLAGNVRPQLKRLFNKQPNWPAVALNGAAVAAEKILTLVDCSA
ncbi:MAG TPA: glycosyltransferase family protein [Candidatus Binatia bacterium]